MAICHWLLSMTPKLMDICHWSESMTVKIVIDCDQWQKNCHWVHLIYIGTILAVYFLLEKFGEFFLDTIFDDQKSRKLMTSLCKIKICLRFPSLKKIWFHGITFQIIQSSQKLSLPCQNSIKISCTSQKKIKFPSRKTYISHKIRRSLW